MQEKYQAKHSTMISTVLFRGGCSFSQLIIRESVSLITRINPQTDYILLVINNLFIISAQFDSNIINSKFIKQDPDDWSA